MEAAIFRLAKVQLSGFDLTANGPQADTEQQRGYVRRHHLHRSFTVGAPLADELTSLTDDDDLLGFDGDFSSSFLPHTPSTVVPVKTASYNECGLNSSIEKRVCSPTCGAH